MKSQFSWKNENIVKKHNSTINFFGDASNEQDTYFSMKAQMPLSCSSTERVKQRGLQVKGLIRVFSVRLLRSMR
jgi:hypothetical protein